jgi:hypothetical protein
VRIIACPPGWVKQTRQTELSSSLAASLHASLNQWASANPMLSFLLYIRSIMDF